MHVLTQLVNGAGGLGKTHTVIECLHRSRDMFELFGDPRSLFINIAR